MVDAILSALEKGYDKGVIQIGPDVCTSIREIAEIIVEISRKAIRIEYDMSKPEGDRGRCADYSKAREVLGWEPRVTMRDGLESLYAWMEKQITRKNSNRLKSPFIS